MYSWGVPPEPWSRIHIDFAGPFLGCTWLLVIDAYTKWLEVFPMKSTTSSCTIKKLRGLFASYGYPKYIVTDNGPQFVAEEFKTFCRNIGITHIKTTPYHPRTNGLAERAVRTFKERMSESDVDLNDRLCSFLFSYRNTPRRSTERSPFEMMFGRRMRSTFDLLKPDVKENMEKAQLRQQLQNYSKPPVHFQPGDSVWVNKPLEKGSEPGMVSARTGLYSYLVNIHGQIKRKHADQMRSRDSYYLSNSNAYQDVDPVPSTSQEMEQSAGSPTLRKSERIRRAPNRYGF